MLPVKEFYADYRPFTGYLRFVWRAITAPNNAARLAWMNRAADYMRLSSRPDLLPLHHQCATVLDRQRSEWPHYDYGEGYFYQGLSALGLTGLRSTEQRVESMGLATLVEGKTVLDIGCNAGFLALSIASSARDIVGLDVNHLLIEIAQIAARHLRVGNVQFLASTFEKAALPEQFDVVLSLANHSTYDGQTAYGLEAYFSRCRSLLRSGGLLIFESHAPNFEGGEKLDRVCEIIASRFNVRERRVLDYGSYLDRGRTWILADVPSAG